MTDNNSDGARAVQPPFWCTDCHRVIKMYRRHNFMSSTEVVCGTCVHGRGEPVAVCQTRESAHAHLKETGRSCAE